MVADFDYTLSKMNFDSTKKGDNSFLVVRNWSGTPDDVKAEGRRLFKHYFPMESDPTIAPLEKIKLLQEWFTSDFG